MSGKWRWGWLRQWVYLLSIMHGKCGSCGDSIGSVLAGLCHALNGMPLSSVACT